MLWRDKQLFLKNPSQWYCRPMKKKSCAWKTNTRWFGTLICRIDFNVNSDVKNIWLAYSNGTIIFHRIRILICMHFLRSLIRNSWSGHRKCCKIIGFLSKNRISINKTMKLSLVISLYFTLLISWSNSLKFIWQRWSGWSCWLFCVVPSAIHR